MSDCEYCTYNVNGRCTEDDGVYAGGSIPTSYETDCLAYVDNANVGGLTPDYVEGFF